MCPDEIIVELEKAMFCVVIGTLDCVVELGELRESMIYIGDSVSCTETWLLLIWALKLVPFSVKRVTFELIENC